MFNLTLKCSNDVMLLIKEKEKGIFNIKKSGEIYYLIVDSYNINEFIERIKSNYNIEECYNNTNLKTDKSNIIFY
jgi:hypothetical protein